MVGVLDGKNTFVAVGVVEGVKVFGSMMKGEGPAVGTVVGLKVLVLEGAEGPVHVPHMMPQLHGQALIRSCVSCSEKPIICISSQEKTIICGHPRPILFM